MNIATFGTKKEEHDMIGEVGDIFLNAMSRRASDVHIEPREKDVRIRFRVDGNFVPYKELDSKHKDSIIARIKIMAYLRIDEHRLPQDGKISYKLFGNKSIDMRVSVLPTIY
jgi:type IV pilus assembly protein PilB